MIKGNKGDVAEGVARRMIKMDDNNRFSNKPKVLVCQGGGAKGAWEAGVIYALMKGGITFKTFFGTSVGALNSALAFTDQPDNLMNIWTDISRKTIWLFELMNIIRFTSLVTSKPLKILISKYVSEKGLAQAKKEGKDLYIWVTDIDSNRLRLIEYGRAEEDEPFLDYLLASASMPLFFPAVHIKGANYGDGGMRVNGPVYLSDKIGIDEIMIIAPIVENNRPDYKFNRLISNLLDEQIRSNLIICKNSIKDYNSKASTNKSQPKIAYLIKPSEAINCDVFSFSKKKCSKDFQLGKRDGELFLESPDTFNLNSYDFY